MIESLIKMKDVLEIGSKKTLLEPGFFKDLNPKFIKDFKEADQALEKIKKIPCRNEHLAGMKHSETGVPFHRKIIEVDGNKYDVVVPEFKSKYNVDLPKEMYKETDRKQFNYANEKLKEATESNILLRNKFSKDQLEQIRNYDTPEGYTWHHDAKAGRLQLVDTEMHDKTGHTGGRAFWGGGKDHR